MLEGYLVIIYTQYTYLCGPVRLMRVGVSGKRAGDNPHQGPVYSLSHSSDGNVLASSGADGSICIWDVKKSNDTTSTSTSSSTLTNNGMTMNGGTTTTAATAVGGGSGGGGEMEEGGPSGAIASFMTKRTPIYHLQFTRRNLLVSAGPFVPYT
jgi:transcription initiation factor TFIID subunit 5